MPVTLAQAKLNVQDALQMGVIDEFAKSSFLFNNLTFDDAVSPVGGGATLTYGYERVKTQPTAAFRAINAEYTAQEAEKEKFTAELKVFGGSFQIDRVIASMGGIIDEVQFQITQKAKAAAALFNDTVINGDSGSDANVFDGLDKALTGSSTEFNTSAAIDLSTSAKVTDNHVAFLDMLDECLMSLDGPASMLAGNTKMIAKLRAIARRVGLYNTARDQFGNQVEMYGNIPLVDLGAKAGSANPVVATNGTSGETSLYAVRLGIDGFHGVSMAGQPPVQSWLPDFSTSGAVKTGEVEMVAAVALKATKAAMVIRKIKVQ